MIIDVTYFNDYLGDLNTDNASIKTDLIGTAQKIIEDYVGYPVEVADYSYSEINIHGDMAILPHPIDSVSVLKLSGVDITGEDLYSVSGNTIYFRDNVRGRKIEVEYKGGFTVIPGAFKIAACKIASLLFMEMGQKIGITGTSFNDGMSHQYVSYTNYQKHLNILNGYRIINA